CRPRDSRTTAPRGRVTARLPVRPATTSPWAAPLLLLFRFLLRILVAAPRPAGTLLRSKPTGVEVVDSLLHLETDGTGPPQEAMLAPLRSGAGASSADRRAGGPGRCACRRCPSQIRSPPLCHLVSRRPRTEVRETVGRLPAPPLGLLY